MAPVLMKAFPQLKFIATTVPHKPELTPSPFGWDIHSYRQPQWYGEQEFTVMKISLYTLQDLILILLSDEHLVSIAYSRL